LAADRAEEAARERADDVADAREERARGRTRCSAGDDACTRAQVAAGALSKLGPIDRPGHEEVRIVREADDELTAGDDQRRGVEIALQDLRDLGLEIERHRYIVRFVLAPAFSVPFLPTK